MSNSSNVAISSSEDRTAGLYRAAPLFRRQFAAGLLGRDEAKAATMVETWLTIGLLIAAPKHDAEQRRLRIGATVDDDRHPSRSIKEHDDESLN